MTGRLQRLQPHHLIETHVDSAVNFLGDEDNQNGSISSDHNNKSRMPMHDTWDCSPPPAQEYSEHHAGLRSDSSSPSIPPSNISTKKDIATASDNNNSLSDNLALSNLPNHSVPDLYIFMSKEKKTYADATMHMVSFHLQCLNLVRIPRFRFLFLFTSVGLIFSPNLF
ncbi:hypothetical protein Peur_068920 [Populus x canadensis]